MATLAFIVWHTKRVCWLHAVRMRRRAWERQQLHKEAVFSKLLSLIIHPSHYRCAYMWPTLLHRNIISCWKQEVKNNISHYNLGSGERWLTGTADYWCIFNRVKDLQWCMWLPFQSKRLCHLFRRWSIPEMSAVVRQTGRVQRIMEESETMGRGCKECLNCILICTNAVDTEHFKLVSKIGKCLYGGKKWNAEFKCTALVSEFCKILK